MVSSFQSFKPQGQALALGGLEASMEGLGLGLSLGLVAQALALNDFVTRTISSLFLSLFCYSYLLTSTTT